MGKEEGRQADPDEDRKMIVDWISRNRHSIASFLGLFVFFLFVLVSGFGSAETSKKLCHHDLGRSQTSSSALPASMEDGSITPIDFYILADASLSTEKSRYEGIEAKIIRAFNKERGDRISYSKFTARTFPDNIQPAYPGVREGYYQVKEGIVTAQENRTDFAHLYRRLVAALNTEWARNREVGLRKHRDVVFILTDGIHDPTNYKDKSGKPLQCPDQLDDSRPFVPPDVKESFSQMVETSAASLGSLWVFMILSDIDSICIPEIQAAWDDELHKYGLNVRILNRDDSAGELIDRILKDSRTGPRIHLKPGRAEISDRERRSLDVSGWFTSEYLVSVITKAELSRGLSKGWTRIEKASLANLDNPSDVVKLFVQINTSDAGGSSGVRIQPDGSESNASLRFQVDSRDLDSFSIEKCYVLNLDFEPGGMPVDCEPLAIHKSSNIGSVNRIEESVVLFLIIGVGTFTAILTLATAFCLFLGPLQDRLGVRAYAKLWYPRLLDTWLVLLFFLIFFLLGMGVIWIYPLRKYLQGSMVVTVFVLVMGIAYAIKRARKIPGGNNQQEELPAVVLNIISVWINVFVVPLMTWLG